MTKVSRIAQEATDLALAALTESAGTDQVGKALEVQLLEMSDALYAVATHTYECSSNSYPGWYWAVSVIALPDQDYATVSEINLLPGPDALVPPAWRPWADRVEPGDLGVGDLLPPPANDPRLTAGFTGLDDLADDLAALHPAQWELGLGREKVLSEVGMEQATSRWLEGQTGPRAAMAKAAPADCSTCGYLIPVGGSLGQAFGICGNELGAADGRIVAMTFGCGAHSSVVVKERPPVPLVELAVDDLADAVQSVDSAPSIDLAEESEDDAS